MWIMSSASTRSAPSYPLTLQANKAKDKILVLLDKFRYIVKKYTIMVKTQNLFSKYEKLIKDDIAVVTNSIAGVNSLAFNDLLAISGISKNSLAEGIFQISLKTISRYQKEGKKFKIEHLENAFYHF